MAMTLKQLAEICNARIEGNDTILIHSAADITSAQQGQVTQLTNNRYIQYIESCQASACFIADDFELDKVPESMSLLRCADPEIAFINALNVLYPVKAYQQAVEPQAVLAETVSLANDVYIGAFAVLGEQVEIGEGSVILAGAYIGNNVKIGKHCRIYPYSVIYDNTVIGDHVVIHSGAIIGADGFGYKFRNYAHVKVPQVGNVIIADHVEIGANTCVDRGALGSTTIGIGSKIDNLVQVGHNNKVGKHVIMCGLTGVSGSCDIGDYAVLAGGVGIADHITIGQGAVIMARAGVPSNVSAGAQMFGSPAKDRKVAYKEQIALSKLPELIKKVQALEEQLENISGNKDKA